MVLSVKWSEAGVKEGSSPMTSKTWKGQGSTTRQIRVKYSDHQLAIKQACGYSTALTESGTRKLRRELPEVYPDDLNMFCSSCRVVRHEKWTGRTAFDRDTQEVLEGYPNADPNEDEDGDTLWKMNVFKSTLLELTYSQADFFILKDATIDASPYNGNEYGRFVSYRDDRSASYITLRQKTLYYITPDAVASNPENAASRSIDFATGKIEGKRTIYLTWHQVANEAIPYETIDNLVGKTNKTAFSGNAAGTLLFLPPKLTRYVMPNGMIGADIEFVLDYFDQGHNKLLKVQGAEYNYYFVTTDPDLTTATAGSLPAKKFIYGEAEFLDMFDCSKP